MLGGDRRVRPDGQVSQPIVALNRRDRHVLEARARVEHDYNSVATQDVVTPVAHSLLRDDRAGYWLAHEHVLE
eukprot:3804313-Rhodomonas_salina.1